MIDLNHQYVNCWRDCTRFRALYRILEATGSTYEVYRQSTPTDTLLNHDAYDGPPFVVILDEFDNCTFTVCFREREGEQARTVSSFERIAIPTETQ